MRRAVVRVLGALRLGLEIFGEFCSRFGELGREFFGVVVELTGFRTDSVGETFCELFGGFSQGSAFAIFWRVNLFRKGRSWELLVAGKLGFLLRLPS